MDTSPDWKSVKPNWKWIWIVHVLSLFIPIGTNECIPVLTPMFWLSNLSNNVVQGMSAPWHHVHKYRLMHVNMHKNKMILTKSYHDQKIIIHQLFISSRKRILDIRRKDSTFFPSHIFRYWFVRNMTVFSRFWSTWQFHFILYSSPCRRMRSMNITDESTLPQHPRRPSLKSGNYNPSSQNSNTTYPPSVVTSAHEDYPAVARDLSNRQSTNTNRSEKDQGESSSRYYGFTNEGMQRSQEFNDMAGPSTKF